MIEMKIEEQVMSWIWYEHVAGPVVGPVVGGGDGG